jgi:hypothetical protein
VRIPVEFQPWARFDGPFHFHHHERKAMSRFDLDDIEALERDEDASMEEEYCALQRGINCGLWVSTGSLGRMAMGAIEGGRCMLGPFPSRDYYGSYIPSRTEVEPGTKGSREFVVERMGEEWAAMLEAS